MRDTRILVTSASTTAVDDRYFGCPGMREYRMESTWHAFCTASVHSTARLVVAEETPPPRAPPRSSGRPSACCDGMSAAVAGDSATASLVGRRSRSSGTKCNYWKRRSVIGAHQQPAQLRAGEPAPRALLRRRGAGPRGRGRAAAYPASLPRRAKY